MMDEIRQSSELVALLADLTTSGEARWVRRTADEGYVFCFARRELIEFEVRGSDAALVDPAEEIHGVHCKIRNVTFVWLEGLDGWDTLLKLLRVSIVDDKRFASLYGESVCSALDGLKTLRGSGI